MSMDPACSPPDPLRRLQQALEPDSGLVLVGGAVRDRLMGRAQGDWDLATALHPDEVMKRARRAGFQVIPTGLQHGTVTVMLDHLPAEITTYRGEGEYLDGRRPESVHFGVSLEEDLARRDFTVNAMALPVEALEAPDWKDWVVDPFQGRRDLQIGLLRAVGEPLKRFTEDGLRPLRACRFAAQLDFEVDAATLEAIPLCLEVAAKVAVERVFQEMTKLLCGAAPTKGLRLLERAGLLDLWFPELRPMVDCPQNRHHDLDVWEHTLAVVAALPPDPGLRWAGLLHDAGKPGSMSVGEDDARHFYGHEALSVELASGLLARMRASRALMHEVAALIRQHGHRPEAHWSDAACRRHLRRLLEDGLPLERWAAFRRGDLSGRKVPDEAALEQHARTLARLETLAATRPPLRTTDLALDGRALMALAQRPGGPWLGELQRHLLEQTEEDPVLNTPEGLGPLALAWLTENRAGKA